MERSFLGWYWIFLAISTLHQTNIAPIRRPGPKRKTHLPTPICQVRAASFTKHLPISNLVFIGDSHVFGTRFFVAKNPTNPTINLTLVHPLVTWFSGKVPESFGGDSQLQSTAMRSNARGDLSFASVLPLKYKKVAAGEGMGTWWNRTPPTPKYLAISWLPNLNQICNHFGNLKMGAFFEVLRDLLNLSRIPECSKDQITCRWYRSIGPQVKVGFFCVPLNWYLTWWKWKSHLPNQQNIGGFLFAPWRIKTVQGKFTILSAAHLGLYSSNSSYMNHPLEHTHTHKNMQSEKKNAHLLTPEFHFFCLRFFKLL